MLVSGLHNTCNQLLYVTVKKKKVFRWNVARKKKKTSKLSVVSVCALKSDWSISQLLHSGITQTVSLFLSVLPSSFTLPHAHFPACPSKSLQFWVQLASIAMLLRETLLELCLHLYNETKKVLCRKNLTLLFDVYFKIQLPTRLAGRIRPLCRQLTITVLAADTLLSPFYCTNTSWSPALVT